MTTLGVLLAAGEGRRFESTGHKLLASFRGRPLVSWSLAAMGAAGCLDELIVVEGAVDLGDLVPPKIHRVENPDWARGQATSVQAAVAAAGALGHDAVVIGLADSPLIPASAWDAVAAAEGDIVAATFDGRRRPPTKLGVAVWDRLPADGDEGARLLFRRWPDLVREVACEGDPTDIDTLEDLAQWN